MRIDALMEARRFVEALPLIERWCEEVAGGTGPDAALMEARARHVLGSVQDRLGDHRPAVENFERALALYEHAGAGPAEHAAAWDEGGRAAQAAGDFELAERWLRASAEARAADPSAAAGSRAQLADVLLKVGRLEEAEAELNLAKSLAGEEPAARWQVARQAAVLAQAVGRPADALQHVDEAKEWASRAAGNKDSLLASLDGQRGLILFRLGQAAQAAQRLERAADYFRDRPDSAGEWLAHENNLAAVWLGEGETAKARDRLRLLLASPAAARLGDSPALITPWLNRAAAEWVAGDRSVAVTALETAQRLAEATLPEVHPLRVQVALGGMVAATASNDRDRARREAKRASDLARAWLGRLGHSADESQWLDFRRTLDPISTLAVVGNEEPEALANAVLSTQGVALERLLAGPAAGQLVSREWQEVVESLPPDSALVNYVWWRPLGPDGRWARRGNYGALVMRSGRPPRWIELGPAPEIEARIRRFIHAARDTVAANRPAETRASLNFQSTQLWELVWSRVLPHLHGVERLFLRPDGMLHFVPWAVMRQPGPTPGAEPGAFFCQIYPQVTAVARATARAPAARKSEFRGWRLAAVADAPGRGAPEPPAGSWGKPSPELWRELLRMPALKGVQLEVEAVRGAAPNDTRVVMAGARESDFAPVKPTPPPNVLHFSGHGFALEQDDDWGVARLEAGLAFADCADGLRAQAAGRPLPANRDGILFAREAAGLPLSGTELVMLSACQTGLGQWQPGEHLNGLRHAFLVAGASHVAATLWDVNDEAAPTFIASFYRRLAAGMTSDQALWQTQRAWLEGPAADLAVRVALAGAWTLEAAGW
ncbi:MAG: CHAT domain-containing protein [Verrucomicrobiales bacterium]